VKKASRNKQTWMDKWPCTVLTQATV